MGAFTNSRAALDAATRHRSIDVLSLVSKPTLTRAPMSPWRLAGSRAATPRRAFGQSAATAQPSRRAYCHRRQPYSLVLLNCHFPAPTLAGYDEAYKLSLSAIHCVPIMKPDVMLPAGFTAYSSMIGVTIIIGDAYFLRARRASYDDAMRESLRVAADSLCRACRCMPFINISNTIGIYIGYTRKPARPRPAAYVSMPPLPLGARARNRRRGAY